MARPPADGTIPIRSAAVDCSDIPLQYPTRHRPVLARNERARVRRTPVRAAITPAKRGLGPRHDASNAARPRLHEVGSCGLLGCRAGKYHLRLWLPLREPERAPTQRSSRRPLRTRSGRSGISVGRSCLRLGSSAGLLPKRNLIAPNPAASEPLRTGHYPAETSESRAIQRIGRSVLQAGGHRFDPGWLHRLNGPDDSAQSPSKDGVLREQEVTRHSVEGRSRSSLVELRLATPKYVKMAHFQRGGRRPDADSGVCSSGTVAR